MAPVLRTDLTCVAAGSFLYFPTQDLFVLNRDFPTPSYLEDSSLPLVLTTLCVDMEQLPERVSNRLGRAGPQKGGAQLDEVDTSKPLRNGSSTFTEIQPEKEKEKDGLQARSRGHAEKAPSSSSNRTHNIVRSHDNESIVEATGELPPPYTIGDLEEQPAEAIALRSPRPEVGDLVAAVYTFEARSSDELSLARGDEALVLEKNDKLGDGWLYGKKMSSEYFGLFPEAYTRLKIRRPTHGEGHESNELQGSNYYRGEHPVDAFHEVLPAAMALNKNSTGHSVDGQLEGTRSQAEECFTEDRADEVRNVSRSDGSHKPLASYPQIRGRHMPWERESFGTWVAKWMTDTLWPPSKDSQRIWYFCVSSSLILSTNMSLIKPMQFLGVRRADLHRCQGA